MNPKHIKKIYTQKSPHHCHAAVIKEDTKVH